MVAELPEQDSDRANREATQNQNRMPSVANGVCETAAQRERDREVIRVIVGRENKEVLRKS